MSDAPAAQVPRRALVLILVTVLLAMLALAMTRLS